ncbi:MAG: hypothetical protein ACO2XZ_01575 [Rickettsiales bacterium]
MQQDDKNLIKLLEVLNKFSVSLTQLINKLAKQNILSLDQLINKLPPKLRTKWQKEISKNNRVKPKNSRSR